MFLTRVMANAAIAKTDSARHGGGEFARFDDRGVHSP